MVYETSVKLGGSMKPTQTLHSSYTGVHAWEPITLSEGTIMGYPPHP